MLPFVLFCFIKLQIPIDREYILDGNSRKNLTDIRLFYFQVFITIWSYTHSFPATKLEAQ